MAKAIETWRRIEDIEGTLPELVVSGDGQLMKVAGKGIVPIDPLTLATCVSTAKRSLKELSAGLKKKGRGKKNAG